MSLDIYLSHPIEQKDTVPVQIWDDQGQWRELTRAEWIAAFPHFSVDGDYPSTETVYSSNMTHNLGRMASEAGVYDCLWRPDENGITTAAQMIEPLRAGIALLESDPERFKPLSASNGWGTYAQFIPWLKEVLAACEMYRDATVGVSR